MLRRGLVVMKRDRSIRQTRVKKVARREDLKTSTSRVFRKFTFSSPEPLVPLSRQGLGHEEQVALGTHDLVGQIFNKGNLNVANQMNRFKIPCNKAILEQLI